MCLRQAAHEKRLCVCVFTDVSSSVSVFVLHSSTLSLLLLLPGSRNCSDKLYDSWRLPGKQTACLFEAQI